MVCGPRERRRIHTCQVPRTCIPREHQTPNTDRSISIDDVDVTQDTSFVAHALNKIKAVVHRTSHNVGETFGLLIYEGT